MNRYQWFTFVDAGIVFMLLTFGLYHFLIFLGRYKNRKDRGNLYLSLFNLALAVFSFYSSLWAKRSQFYYPGILDPFLENLCILIMIVCTKKYLEHLSGFKGPKTYFAIVFCGLVLPMIFGSYSLRGYFNYLHVYRYKELIAVPVSIAFGVMFLLTIAPYVIHVIQLKKKQDPTLLAAFSGLLFILAFILTKRILHQQNLARFFNNSAVIIGAFLFAFAQAIQFRKEHRQLENLSNDLQKEVDKQTDELKRGRDNLERINRKRTETFINLAHETRTPLTVIRYNLEQLDKGRNNSPELQNIKNNLVKLQRDMINFLDSEKILKGDTLYQHSQTVDLKPFLEEKAEFFRPVVTGKGLVLKTEFQNSIWIKADPFALDRIFNNLLMNAVKFTSSGMIRIKLQEEGDYAVVMIEDSGRGMSKEQIAGLFMNPYNQLENKKENIQGYGVGLFVTKTLVEELLGSIRIDSIEGKGSVFTLQFPSAPETADQQPQRMSIRSAFEPTQERDIENYPLKQKAPADTENTILLAEDNKELLAILESELSANYRILTAGGGKEALRILSYAELPDVIISDIMMDEGSGEELLDAVSADPRLRTIPFIFLTAMGEENVKSTAYERGAVEYITKPFSIEDLRRRIAALIRLTENQRTRTLDSAIRALEKERSGQAPDPENDRRRIFEKNSREWSLSERQKEIAGLLADGLEHKEIAWQLNISKQTVKRHVQNLYEKLQVHNKVELINRLFS